MLTAARPYPDSIHQQSKNPLNPTFVNQKILFNKQRNKRSGSSSAEEQLNKNMNLFNILLKKSTEEDKINHIRKALKQGADIDFQDANRDDNTLLHVAVKKRYLKVVEYLLKESIIKVNLENKNKDTPKDLAKDNPEIINIFEKFSFTSENHPPLIVQESLIPNGFKKGTAVGGGDCFFDTLAQGMNQLPIPGGPFDVQSLRNDCAEYARDHADSVIQHTNDKTWRKMIADDATAGGYATEGNGEQDNFNSYLVGIQLTAESGIAGRQPVWGRPEIEGRMLCQKYGIKLHLIEKLTANNEEIICHQLIDATGSKSIDVEDNLYRDSEVVHLLNEGRAHFEPILQQEGAIVTLKNNNQKTSMDLSKDKPEVLAATVEGVESPDKPIDRLALYPEQPSATNSQQELAVPHPSQSANSGNRQADNEANTKQKIKDRKISIHNRELLISAGEGNEERIQSLIHEGVNINFQDRDGNTALHYAVEGGKLEIVKLLLDNGADVNLVNSKGDTPLTLSKQLNKENITPILEHAKKIQSSLSGYLEDVRKQDEAARDVFNIEKNPEKEGYENLLPISENHYLILDGDIRDGVPRGSKISASSQVTSEAVKFSESVNRIVRSIILKFDKISGKEIINNKNFLFYLIKKSDKKLKILVAISGTSKSGQEGYSTENTECQNKLNEAIKDSNDANENLYGYSIEEGLFVPFSRKEERSIKKDDGSFTKFQEAFNKYPEQAGFIKISLIAKLLQGSLTMSSHVIETMLKKSNEINTFIGDFNEANKISNQIKDKIKKYKKENKNKEIGDPGEFIESITLTLLKEIEEKIGKNNQKDVNSDSDNIKENIDFLKKQSRRIHFNKPKKNIDDFIKTEKVDIARYKKSLEKVWKHSDDLDIFSIIQYQAHCSEDNLIDYLSYQSDILKEEGVHYIFSVIFSVKKGVKKIKSTKGKETSIPKIKIRPPCSHCILHFPLEISEIASSKAGLPNFVFEKRLTMPKSIDNLSFDEKLLYLSENAPEIFLENIFNENRYLSNNFIPSLFKNLVKRNMIGVLKKYSNFQHPYAYSTSLTEALGYASQFGSTEVIEYFIDKSKHRVHDRTGENRDKALLSAIDNNHIKAVEKLLEFDESDFYHLFLASRHKRKDIFEALIDKIPDEKRLEVLEDKLIITPDKNREDILHYDLLYGAIDSSNIEMIKFIWGLQQEKGIKPEDKTITIEKNILHTPLHIASIRGDYEIIEFLVNQGFFIEKDDCYHQDSDTAVISATALNIAVNRGYKEVASFLLKEMMDRKMTENIKISIKFKKEETGATALHELSKYGYDEIIEKLLSNLSEEIYKKSVVCSVDKKNMTPLHFAAAFGHEKFVTLLLTNGAREKIDARSEDLFTPLHFACKGGYQEVVKTLLGNGADIEAKGKTGERPLHFAAEKGRDEVVKTLLDKGADIEAEYVDGRRALHLAAENGHRDVVEYLLQEGADVNAKTNNGNGATAAMLAGRNKHKEVVYLIVKHKQSLYTAKKIIDVFVKSDLGLMGTAAGQSCRRRRRDLRGCGGEEQGRVFPYEPLEESVSVEQQRAARLQSQLALAVVWGQQEPADKLLQYQRYLGDILNEGAVNQSPREQGLLRDHYQQAQQFFADNPKTTLLEVRVDNFEPLAGHSVLLENGQQSLLVFNAGERYQLYSPDFNYRQRFQTHVGVSWSELSGFIRAFFAWKSGSGEYRPLVLTDQLPGKALAQLQAAPYWEPDTLAPDSVLLAREQAGLIEGIPARVVRELVRVNGQVVDSAALHADFFQTPGIQLRVEKLHSVLTELTEVQRRALVQGVNKYHWSADSTLLETLSTEERPLLADYQQQVMNELKTADTLTPERLSEFSWQAMAQAQAIEKQPELPAELKQPVLDNLKAMHRTASQRAWAKGMATQTLFFLPDMIRAANTGQVGGLVGTAGMLAADGGVNHLYGRLLERLAPTLGEARLGLLQKLPVTSPVFKALTVYSIVELTKQLHSLPPNSEQRQTIKHRLGEQYVTIGIMAAELLGLETGPLWIGLMAEQLIFEAMTFRKENQLDIPFWEAFIMSLGFEQDKLQHIIEERQLVELNLATVDNINTQANPPYGWVLVKVPSLGPLTWLPLDESQVPPHIREEIINQPLPFSIFPSTTITREAASFRQIEHYELNWVFMTEGDAGSLMTGNFASPTLGKLLNTTWHLGTYTAQATAIHMQWGPSGRSCQEDNVFLATPKAPLANYRRIASVTGKNHPFCLPRTPVKISGPGLAALYVNNHTTATEGAPRNLYLGFDPREGDITLLIQPSGLRELDNINRDYHPDAAPDDNGSYSLTVQVSNKGYPPAIMFQPQLGILMVEEKSRRLHSHYFISSDTAPFYLYDDALTTRIAISPPSHRPIGFIVRSYGPKGLIQLQTWSPNSTQPIPAFPPSWYTDRHAVNFKKALQPLLPHQVSTLYLPNKKYLQLMLDRQQIAGVLMLEAEQVEVLAAKGQDAYQSGIYMTTAVTRFTVTLVGHLQVMQGNTRLFFIGETPDNTTVIRYSTQPSAPHSPMYQLELPVLQPVLDSLCRLDSREIHFSTPGLRYAWVPDVEQPAVLKIMAPLNGQLAQLLLEQNGTTLSQLDEQQQWRIMAVDHYNQHAMLDNQLVLQQVITGGNTTNLGVYQSAGDPAQDLQVVDSVYPQGPGDILWFQSPQGYPVLHRFASGQKMTLNGIDYQIADNRLYAIGAQTGIIDGDQLIRYRTPTRRVGIRVTSSLAESQLSWDKGELTINQLTLRNLPEQTPIDLGGQAFPLKALKESVHRPRHHHRRDIPRAEPLTSGAARHQPWTSTLFKEAATLLGGISWKWTTWGSTPTLTGQPSQPPQNSKITVDEYTSGHFQGLLQLLDLGVRQWTGQKYRQPAVIATGSWAEASVQAAQVIEEFHQTLQGAARACGVKLSTLTQRLDEVTLRNQVAQKLYTGQPQAIEKLLQPVVQSLYQTLCSRATQKQADRFMAHWNRHYNQSVDIRRLQQQWVSLPNTHDTTCLMTNKVDPLSIPQLPTRPLSRNHLT